MVASLTEVLDNMYASTWQHMQSEIIDNIFNATPFWYWLKEKGKLRSVSGGRHILETLEYAENDGVGFIGRGGTVPLNDREFLTNAYFDWRYLVAPIVRFGVDDQKNRGKTRILDLVKAKLNNAQESQVTVLESTLFAGAGAEGGAFDGLQLLVANDPTAAATVGGIPQSTHTWWRNKTDTMTGVSFATNGTARMRTMVNNCQNNRAMDRPDIIVTTQTVFEYCEDNILDKFQINDKKFSDLGFENTKFKNIPLVWSPSCGSQRMYFLNTKYLSFVYDPALFFDMTEWKAIPDQVNDRAAQIMTACSFTTNRRRVHGVIHTIDTP
jgi:hypothetical protein